MQEKTNMNELYDRIMSFREREPKRFALIRIREKYETIEKRANSGKMDEVRFLVNELNSFIPAVCKRYGVSKIELLNYFKENNMKLSF